ncbi:MAG TPA: hypothetical protein VGM51_00130 [Armatimonadota bacterium]|jgi:hypothetical protein
MHVKSLLAALFVAAAITTSAYAGVIDVAMDHQINFGMPGTPQLPTGNAIYTPQTGFEGTPGPVTFGTDGTVG